MVKTSLSTVDRLVVINASPIIELVIVDGLKWLPELFGDVYLPESVKTEVLPEQRFKGKESIAQAIDSGWLTLWGLLTKSTVCTLLSL